jgi:hypothetical protein
MTPTSDMITLLSHMIRQFQDNSTPHLNKSLFKHNEIFIRKDGVHVEHIKTSIRHVYTGFAHDNMTFWNNKRVFRQISTTFWQDKMNIWPNKTLLRQVPIKCWQANTSIIHNKTLLGKNKTKFNNMRQLWRSILFIPQCFYVASFLLCGLKNNNENTPSENFNIGQYFFISARIYFIFGHNTPLDKTFLLTYNFVAFVPGWPFTWRLSQKPYSAHNFLELTFLHTITVWTRPFLQTNNYLTLTTEWPCTWR